MSDTTTCPVCTGKVEHIVPLDKDFGLLCPACQRRAKCGSLIALSIVLAGFSVDIWLQIMFFQDMMRPALPLVLFFRIFSLVIASLLEVPFVYVLWTNWVKKAITNRNRKG
jgi:hypothetical protein